jgi:RNA polymerase sigma-70 factor (ECF subfamily)
MRPEGVDERGMASGGLLGAFIELRPALSRYLMLRGASADEAEDILQEVYLTLSADRIGPVAEPRAYLYRMTTNHFLLSRRTAGRRTRREEDWVEAHSGEEREIDEQPSAEARLIAREQLAILQRVLDGLPERTRTIFRRFRIDGEPQRQIAADIGISVSAVEKHLTRAYEAIAAAKLRLDGDRSHPRHLSDRRGRHGV